MADGRASKVLSTFVDIHSNANFVLERLSDAGPAMERNERLAIPNIGDLTIYSDASVPRAAGARNTPSVNELVVVVDQEPWIPTQVPAKDATQVLQGSYMSELARHSFIQLRNHLDALILDDYLATEIAWVASGATTYHYNAESDGLTPANLLVARGRALRVRGTLLSNLLLVLDPLAAAAVMGFAGWTQVTPTAGAASFGADTIGKIYGMEVVETQAVRLSKEFEPLTAAVNGHVLTLTFDENPGFVVGEPLSSSGLQANYDIENEAVVSVSADGLTVTTAHAGGDDADVLNGGTVTGASASNLLFDRAHVHRAMQVIPNVRIVPDPDTNGDIMQISCLLGYKARAGRVWVIHTPEDSIT